MIQLEIWRLVVAGALIGLIGFFIGVRRGLIWAGWLIGRRAAKLGMAQEVEDLFNRMESKE